MKQRIFTIAATICLSLMMGVVASAQSARQMTVTIPFDFNIGKKALPAGTYTFYRLSSQTGEGFFLRDKDGEVRVVFNTQQAQSNKPKANSRLEFRRYNDKYFLGSIWSEGNNRGHELIKSRLERKTAKGETRNLAQADVEAEIVTVAIR